MERQVRPDHQEVGLMELNPDTLSKQVCDAGYAWADAEAVASQLEELRKVVLAELMNGLEGSVASREQKALGMPEYRKHIQGMVEARRAANRAKVRYYAMQANVELKRSVEATKRAELTLR